MTEARPEEIALIPSPATGEPGSLTAPRSFNMMFQTNVGAMTDASSVAYLRPETAQGMFADFKSVVDTGRVKLPFGIAQIGKSFRNEITPRNFIFRSREFEQMEMEYFIHEDADWAKCHREWINWCRDCHLNRATRDPPLGIQPPEGEAGLLLAGNDRHHVQVPLRRAGALGIAARGDYDLKQHEKHSGVPQTIFDEATKKKFVPHVIRAGSRRRPHLPGRALLRIRGRGCAGRQGQRREAHRPQAEPKDRPREGRRAPPPKEQPALVARAEELHRSSSADTRCSTTNPARSAAGYRRQDEIGTPWCVTIDFEHRRRTARSR